MNMLGGRNIEDIKKKIKVDLLEEKLQNWRKYIERQIKH